MGGVGAVDGVTQARHHRVHLVRQVVLDVHRQRVVLEHLVGVVGALRRRQVTAVL